MSLPFMSVEHLKTFNDQYVKDAMIGSNKKTENKSSVSSDAAFDPNKYDSFIVSADKLDDQILYGLVEVFDNKVSAMNGNTKAYVEMGSPTTYDKILSSLAVGYITEDGIPVAGCTLRDPTTSDYHGVIPSDHYEMLSGINLENRIEQEFFEVHPDYHDVGMASELRRLISTVVDKTYIVVPVVDEETINGLNSAGYKMVSKFVDDNDDQPSLLWIND